MAYKSIAKDYTLITYETEIQVKNGDCLDLLIEKYYDRCNNNISWQEYRYNMADLNYGLLQNGRALQPGDMVRVQWYIKAEMEK